MTVSTFSATWRQDVKVVLDGLTIGTTVQAWDANLDQIAALTPTDSNFIVGNGSAWVAESGATARASMGAQTDLTAVGTIEWGSANSGDRTCLLDFHSDDTNSAGAGFSARIGRLAGVNGTYDFQQAGTGSYRFFVQTSTLALSINSAGDISVTGALSLGTALAIAQGGTGAPSASGARTNLGLGTASLEDTGTSGATVPLLNGANTWSSQQTLSATTQFDGQASFGTFSSTGASSGKRVLSGSYVMDTSTNSTSNTSHFRLYNPNGQVGSINTNASSTAYNTSSDGRLKRNHRDFDSGVILDALTVTAYERVEDCSTQYGVVAQNTAPVFPDAVAVGVGDPGDADFVPWMVDYSKFVPLLLREVQALRARVVELESRQPTSADKS